MFKRQKEYRIDHPRQQQQQKQLLRLLLPRLVLCMDKRSDGAN